MSDQLLTTMFQRKRRLLLLLLLATLTAILLYNILPKSFTVTNGIRIGRFMGVPLELAEYTKQRFKMVGFLAEAYEKAELQLDVPQDDLPRTVKVSIENDFNKINNIDTLIYSTRGSTPQVAQEMSAALSDYLIGLHGQRLAEARAIREKEVEAWREGVVETRAKIAQLEDMLTGNMGTSLNQAAMLILTSKFQDQRAVLFNMMQLQYSVTLKNDNPVESYNTEAVSEARAPERAAFPKLSHLLLALYVVAGLAWATSCWLETVLATHKVTLRD